MELSTRKLGNKIRKLKIEPNSMILIKSDTIFALDGNIDKFTDIIDQTGIKNVVVVVVDDLADMTVLPEKKLNELGWFKLDYLRKVIKQDVRGVGG